jgi:hypothetical protein
MLQTSLYLYCVYVLHCTAFSTGAITRSNVLHLSCTVPTLMVAVASLQHKELFLSLTVAITRRYQFCYPTRSLDYSLSRRAHGCSKLPSCLNANNKPDPSRTSFHYGLHGPATNAKGTPVYTARTATMTAFSSRSTPFSIVFALHYFRFPGQSPVERFAVLITKRELLTCTRAHPRKGILIPHRTVPVGCWYLVPVGVLCAMFYLYLSVYQTNQSE